jgi:hypothetical protein
MHPPSLSHIRAPSHLLALPAEIRCLIYATLSSGLSSLYLFPRHVSKVRGSRRSREYGSAIYAHGRDIEQVQALQFLGQTCRVLRAEVMGWVGKEVRVRVTGGWFARRGGDEMGRQWLSEKLPEEMVSELRCLEIEVCQRAGPEREWVEDVVRDFGALREVVLVDSGKGLEGLFGTGLAYRELMQAVIRAENEEDEKRRVRTRTEVLFDGHDWVRVLVTSSQRSRLKVKYQAAFGWFEAVVEGRHTVCGRIAVSFWYLSDVFLADGEMTIEMSSEKASAWCLLFSEEFKSFEAALACTGDAAGSHWIRLLC